MGFGTDDRRALKREAKQHLMKSIRYCVTASAVLVLLSIVVEILKLLLSSSIPDFLGLSSVTDPSDINAYMERFMADPLTIGTQLGRYYAYEFLYGLLADTAGVILKAPLMLAFMGGLYRIAVHEEVPERRRLFGWYARIGLSARAVSLMFLLEVIFEVLLLALFLGPLVLLVYLSVVSMAGGGYLPVWATMLPLVSGGGLVLGALLYSSLLPALHFMAKYPHLGPFGALKKSARELKGHRWQYIVLILSFLPWLILESVTYGAAGIYVIPYMELTVTLFLERIKLPDDPPQEEMSD